MVAVSETRPQRIDLKRLIDESQVTGYHWIIFVLCGLCLIMDGFDLQSIGFVAPAMSRELGIARGQLGPVLTAALFGVLFGSLILSSLADRFGRRPVLIAGCLIFAALTIGVAMAQTLNQLLWLRFLSGIGLGGMMPNAMALCGELAPRKVRITVMMVISTGLTAGGAVGGFTAAYLIPLYGWRSVFFAGGIIPLVIAAIMFFGLPESPQFQALRGVQRRNLLKTLRRLIPGSSIAENAEFSVAEQSSKGAPLGDLFRDGRGTTTVLLWVVNFMNLLNLYFLNTWVTVLIDTYAIPKQMVVAGLTLQIPVMVATSVSVGGVIGSFGNAWLINRVGFFRALIANSSVACIAIALIGREGLPLSLLFLVVFISGWGITGGQPGVNSLAALYYPTYLRSSGIGWGLGVGRLGAIAGPLISGELVKRQWAPSQVFLAAAVPAVVSAITLIVLSRVMVEPAKAHAQEEIPPSH